MKAIAVRIVPRPASCLGEGASQASPSPVGAGMLKARSHVERSGK